jgi:ABC-type nitrate/sulfonate/bicarbonate transport system ATPase subunit
MNVEQNIKFALSNSEKSSGKTEIKKIINDVELTGYEEHFSDSKSLGFRFRTALARAVSINPKIILLDDPFKRMNSETKEEIFSLLQNICKNYHVVFILATTNLIEAIILSKMLFLLSSDTGTIFDKLEIELGNSTLHSPLKDEKFLELLNRVELKLRERNITDMITHSV